MFNIRFKKNIHLQNQLLILAFVILCGLNNSLAANKPALCNQLLSSAELTLQIVNSIPLNGFGITVDVGSYVKIVNKNKKENPIEAIFLGRLDHHNLDQYFGFYIKGEEDKIIVYPQSHFSKVVDVSGESVDIQTLRPQLISLKQYRDICAGHACYNQLRLLSLLYPAAAQLNGLMANANVRTENLTNILNDLFIRNRGLPTASVFDQFLTTALKELNFSRWVRRARMKGTEATKDYILTNLKAGWPIILFYDVSNALYEPKYKTVNVSPSGDESVASPKLYVPRIGAEPVLGLHALVLTGYVKIENKGFLIVSDSVHGVPQLWPESMLDRAAAADMIAWVAFPNK